MSVPREPLRVTTRELYHPVVDGYIEQQAMLARSMPDEAAQPLWKRVLFAGWFYLSVAGAMGAFIAWAIVEPFIDERQLANQRGALVALALFSLTAGLIGVFLGAVEGMMVGNPRRAVLSALIGGGVGLGGGLVMLIPTGMVYAVLTTVAAGMGGAAGFLVHMIARSLAWGLIASAAGIGQGIAVQQKKVLINGLVGAVLGGLLGGFLFDPIDYLLSARTAVVSRAVAIVAIGMFVGLFVGLVEQITKSAWLLMRAGPLAGKQFVLYRNPTVLGSSPKADVYLFKDDAIEPRHALIYDRGGRYEIQDCQTPDGTYINGYPIKSRVLQPGDKIMLGKTILEFSIREAK